MEKRGKLATYPAIFLKTFTQLASQKREKFKLVSICKV